ncbi:MAG: heme exporter protein CcmD [Methylococcaceae bacterium]|nr:MAG: heme exporter protein CcmD [Methylococcaceae bacterium]
MEEFFHMGGYAFYIWTSYGLALAVLLVNVVLPLRRKSQVLRNLESLQRQAARRKA